VFRTITVVLDDLRGAVNSGDLGIEVALFNQRIDIYHWGDKGLKNRSSRRRSNRWRVKSWSRAKRDSVRRSRGQNRLDGGCPQRGIELVQIGVGDGFVVPTELRMSGQSSCQ
jgi:hypothetical protein